MGLTFNLIDIGAMHGLQERFYSLLSQYPGSKIHAFDAQEKIELPTESKGVTRYPYALGSDEGTRTFYKTQHPMCASLYEPLPIMIDLFQGLEPQTKIGKGEVYVHTLDHIVWKHNIGQVDLLKIDAQGASYEILHGADKTLDTALMVICEAELIPLYEGEPLIGDISSLMEKSGFFFQGMHGSEGRAFRKHPKSPEVPLWTNAIYMKDVINNPVDKLAAHKLKVLLELYDIQGWSGYLMSI